MTISVITPTWPLQDKVQAFTTTRLGGASRSPYDNFNLALHVNDDPNDVNENRRRLQSLLLPGTQVKWLKQTHSNIVANAFDIAADVIEADASFTISDNIACAVLTADCLPILLADESAECIAAVHAGWRGIVNGVINNTVAAMSEYIKPTYAWLGPAIGAHAFEVGEEVYSAYLDYNSHMANCFEVKIPGKWKLNIYQAAKIVLQAADIDYIFGGEYCTYNDTDQFFSFRRQSTTGRMATIISKR